MKIIKKITSKKMGCDKETVAELVMADKNVDVKLYNVVGPAFRATVEDHDNDMGEFIKFHGTFRGQSFLTGEEIDSGVLILPDIAANMIAPSLLAQEDEEAASRSFARINLTVTARYEKTAACMYVFGVEIHNKPQDALNEMLAEIPPEFRVPGLPVPEPPEKTKSLANGKATKPSNKKVK